jgi:hypothetical protein
MVRRVIIHRHHNMYRRGSNYRTDDDLCHACVRILQPCMYASFLDLDLIQLKLKLDHPLVPLRV